MDTHRAVHIGITLGQGFDVGGVFSADTDAQEVPYPTLASGFEGRVEGAAVLGEVEAIKVAMGIYDLNHGKCLAHDTPAGLGN